MKIQRVPLTISIWLGWVGLFGLSLWWLAADTHETIYAQSEPDCSFNITIPSASLTITLTEGGPLASYSITLCSEPQILVTVELHLSGNAQQLLIEPLGQIFYFDSTDWNQTQRVMIDTVDDTVAEPTLIFTMHHSMASTDPNFNRSQDEMPTITILVLDNDTRAYLPITVGGSMLTPTPTPTSTPPPQWQYLTTTPPHVDVLVVNNNQLFAGDRSDDINIVGIYRSPSCAIGATFAKLQGNVRVQDFAFSGQFGIAATNGDRVYYSTNNGDSWQRTNSTMNQFVFAVAIINIGQAYAGADDGVYRSTDNGASWSKVAPAGGNGPTLINAFTYASAENTLWIGTQGGGVWKLTPSSTQFTQVIGGLANPDSDRRVWDILRCSATEYYIATTNGVYTGNGTGNWSPFGLQGLQVLSLELIDNTLYAGVRDGGVRRRSLDGASDWSQESGIAANLTVRDLFYDQSGLCNNQATGRKALLAGTTNGIWVYR
jgi:hypothetical protein